MKNKIFKTFLITVVLTVLFAAVANGVDNYELYKSNVKIFFNEKEMKFDDSIVTINNKTYIPLREMAEQMNMQIEWSEEEQKVMLSEKLDMIEAENVFSKLFGFELTSTSKILEYDYKIENQEQYFVSKISFEKKDLEQVENGCSKFSIAPDSLQKVKRGTTPLSYCANQYEWWDLLKLTDETEVYHSVKTGVYKKSVSIWMFITEGSNNEYYLYVVYG